MADSTDKKYAFDEEHVTTEESESYKAETKFTLRLVNSKKDLKIESTYFSESKAGAASPYKTRSVSSVLYKMKGAKLYSNGKNKSEVTLGGETNVYASSSTCVYEKK
jgi:hypothetical protein